MSDNDDDDDENDDSALLRAVPAVGRLVWIDVIDLIEKACDAGVNASSRYAKAMDLVIFYFLCRFVAMQYDMRQVAPL